MLVSARALTVFVVAQNDSQKLLATIDRIYNALAVTIEDLGIVVFDDGSTDDTLAVAKAVWSGKISDCWSFHRSSASVFSGDPTTKQLLMLGIGDDFTGDW